jgi:hypothetical protein
MRRNSKGQAAVELVIALGLIVIPLTFAMLGFVEIVWTYHALTTLTRQGAQYATSHCWQDSAGTNVVTWMQENAPMFPDRSQIVSGGIQIQVQYWTHDPESHTSIPFECGGGCGAECVPDSVTVSIAGYSFNHFFPMLGFSPIQVPPFATTMAMQSAGVNPETGAASP